MAVYIFIFALYAIGILLSEKMVRKGKLKSGSGAVLAVFLMTLCIRLFFATRDLCYYYDIDCFKAWAELSHIHGLKGMYKGEFFLDYPPGYIYILWLTGAIKRALDLDYHSLAFSFLIKRGPVLTDMIFGAVIYDIARKEKGDDFAFLRCTAWLFNPAMLYNSSVWGQVDSFYIFFIVLSLYFITKDKIIPASLSYAIALITKPQSLLFGPVLLLYMIEKKNIKYLLTAVGTGVLTMYLLVLPYTNGLNPLWIFNLYNKTLSSFPYYTVNAYNIYTVKGKNWRAIDGIGIYITPIIVAVLLVLLFWQYFKHRTADKNFTSAFVSIVILFTLCTKMHERYLLPAIALSLMAWVIGNNIKYLYYSVFATGVCFINIVSVLIGTYTEHTIAPLEVKITGTICCLLCALAVATYITGSECLRKEK